MVTLIIIQEKAVICIHNKEEVSQEHICLKSLGRNNNKSWKDFIRINNVVCCRAQFISM